MFDDSPLEVLIIVLTLAYMIGTGSLISDFLFMQMQGFDVILLWLLEFMSFLLKICGAKKVCMVYACVQYDKR